MGSSVAFTDDEVERMRGAAVFTHNHPGGESFSTQDVAMAATLEWGELRVVTAQWTHVLRPGQRGWSAERWASRLEDASEQAFLEITDQFQKAISRRKLSIEEANADFWHEVWERVAEHEGLDYERFAGDRYDAD